MPPTRRNHDREHAVDAGLAELDRWLGDRLDEGLLTFESCVGARCETIARRLVDARATGLASMVRAIPAGLPALAEAERHEWLAERLAGLHLVASAYRRRDLLPGPAREEVHRLVGRTPGRRALLAVPGLRRRRTCWCVVHTASIDEGEGVVRRETWLRALAPEPAGPGDWAVLVDHVAGGNDDDAARSVGEVIDAECAWYPAVVPLRAVLVDDPPADGAADGTATPAPVVPAARTGLAEALDDFDAALASAPWMARLPLSFRDARFTAAGDGSMHAVVGDGSGAAVAVARASEPAVAALVGFRADAVHGLHDGRRFEPVAVETSAGPWWLAWG